MTLFVPHRVAQSKPLNSIKKEAVVFIKLNTAVFLSLNSLKK